MLLRPFRLLCVFLAVAPCGWSQVPAITPNPAIPAPSATTAHELTRDEATQIVQHRYGARVIKIELTTEAGRKLYVCRLLQEPGGKVRDVRIDATSGEGVP